MSDALLTEISAKLTTLIAAVKGGSAAGPTAGAKTATATTTDTKAADAAKKKAEAEAKVKAEAKAKLEADAVAKAAAAGKGPPAGTKAPGGKYAIEQVRELIRQVASNASLGKQSAKDVLTDDGGGVTRVVDLKPEFYDAVAEACKVLLSSEGSKAESAAEEDDLM
jgi:colicin import membrane protein